MTVKIPPLNCAFVREFIFRKFYFARWVKEEPKTEENPVQVEEEFPDLKNLNPAGFKSPKVDLSREEMFAKVKQMGLKIRATASNEELKKIKENG
mgnify:CR=1 FL=1